MSRTVKREWSKPDGWHLGKRLERKARPAGRIVRQLAQEGYPEGCQAADQADQGCVCADAEASQA